LRNDLIVTRAKCKGARKLFGTHTIPQTGFLRLPQVLSVIPVSKSTWWQGVKDGKYPAGVKLSPKCTAWRAEEIHALIKRLGA
jgi:predicted DNA-binding transcriptional regulator AlpA